MSTHRGMLTRCAKGPSALARCTDACGPRRRFRAYLAGGFRAVLGRPTGAKHWGAVPGTGHSPQWACLEVCTHNMAFSMITPGGHRGIQWHFFWSFCRHLGRFGFVGPGRTMDGRAFQPGQKILGSRGFLGVPSSPGICAGHTQNGCRWGDLGIQQAAAHSVTRKGEHRAAARGRRWGDSD